MPLEDHLKVSDYNLKNLDTLVLHCKPGAPAHPQQVVPKMEANLHRQRRQLAELETQISDLKNENVKARRVMPAPQGLMSRPIEQMSKQSSAVFLESQNPPTYSSHRSVYRQTGFILGISCSSCDLCLI